MKSQGEKKIADYFYRNGINYTYEDPAKTTTSAFREKISKPDFYLPDYQVYAEYWGLIDVDDLGHRKKYRETMEWKKQQYEANGLKCISLYPWHLEDLDAAFKVQFRRVMKRELVLGPVGEQIVYALPVTSTFRELLIRSYLQNAPLLNLSELHLSYLPYYFIGYDCFAQESFMYQKLNLTSVGLLVIQAGTGMLVDSETESGDVPTIGRTGYFTDCASLQQKEVPRAQIAEGTRFTKFEAPPSKITESEAKEIAQIAIAKNLSHTYVHTFKNGTTRAHTIRPWRSNVRITSAKLINIPIITGVFAYRNKIYRRTIQAATGKMMDDEFYCNTPARHSVIPKLICATCGDLACQQHGRNCAVCGLSLCLQHIKARGLVFKKYYCSEHAPA